MVGGLAICSEGVAEMQRGTHRSAIAVGMLAICQWMAVPLTAEARLLEPSHHGSAGIELREEAGLWQQVWQALRSVWDRSSVLIDPFG